MNAEEPRKEHQWLQQLIGEWTYEFDASPGPGKPVEKMMMKGTETVRALGSLWVLIEARGEASPGPDSQITLGFDPPQGKFVGTFISSSMSRLWIYEQGALEGERQLVLKSVGPSMAEDGKIAPYEDVYELVSDTERAFKSRVQKADGTWVEFMRGTYRRVGKK